MDLFLQLLGQYGLPIVFIAVLLEQGGLPLPAYPVVIVASSLTVAAGEPVWPIALATTLAAVTADIAWFAAGRRFGGRMLRLMCSLSLSRDSCVGSARETYARWGLPSLVVAKFVPGLAAVATILAGQMRIEPLRFLLYDGAGALLWAMVAVGLGVAFHDVVNDVLALLDAWGGFGLLVIVALVGAFVAYKSWQRLRFRRRHRMARITVTELQALLEGSRAPIIIDVRADTERADGWIPGAVPPSAVATVAGAAGTVIYCDCPEEASAAKLARQLDPTGRGNVRPLVGGFQAWKDAGLPVQHPASAGTSARPPAPPAPPAPSQEGKGAADRPELVPGRHAYAGGK